MKEDKLAFCDLNNIDHEIDINNGVVFTQYCLFTMRKPYALRPKPASVRFQYDDAWVKFLSRKCVFSSQPNT
ncbi:hypothetical protein CIK83_10920 [Vibrio casei]|uniref:Uncharacterized protein n=1 Tax=Vibrio casei TaxID=673372 RepID=A0A368LGY4_9VIBR|nr:hypothetical protein CIK83_10920 [Vibrio casei]